MEYCLRQKRFDWFKKHPLPRAFFDLLKGMDRHIRGFPVNMVSQGLLFLSKHCTFRTDRIYYIHPFLYGSFSIAWKGIELTMKIVLTSVPVKNRNIEFNLQAMVDAMADCRGKADIILFGESVLQGFDSLCWDYETDKHMAVTLTDPPIQRMCETAKKNRLAVSFGFIEKIEDALYSSQIFIGADGRIVDLFHRVSIGWKESQCTDAHYREGEHFHPFCYGGKIFSVGLCGDLWTHGRPEEMKTLNADIVLWPVWCDYAAEEWNEKIKFEYAEQAALCGKDVLLVNPYCADPDAADCASGGLAHFRDGQIWAERPAGTVGILITDI